MLFCGSMGVDAQSRLDELSRTQLGLVTRAQVLEAGLSVKAIERRLASGAFTCLRRRVYRLRGGSPDTAQQRLLAVCLSLDTAYYMQPDPHTQSSVNHH